MALWNQRLYHSLGVFRREIQGIAFPFIHNINDFGLATEVIYLVIIGYAHLLYGITFMVSVLTIPPTSNLCGVVDLNIAT